MISGDSLNLREMSCGVQIQTGRKSWPGMLLIWFTTEEDRTIGVCLKMSSDVQETHRLVGGFNHLEKHEFVHGKDDIPYIMQN